MNSINKDNFLSIFKQLTVNLSSEIKPPNQVILYFIAEMTNKFSTVQIWEIMEIINETLKQL